MKRRLFLVTLLMLAAPPAARPAMQGAPPQEAPADRVTVEEFTRLRAAHQVFVLDVRYRIDKKIRGARHVPLEQLEARLAGLPRDREIVTYCS